MVFLTLRSTEEEVIYEVWHISGQSLSSMRTAQGSSIVVLVICAQCFI